MTAAESTPVRASLDRVAQGLEAAGSRLTAHGDHLQATCPAHEDHEPSLSVDYRPDARKPGVHLHCHAGCDSADVLAALGLTYSDLYDEPPAKPDGPRRTTTAPARTTTPAKKTATPKPPAAREPACLGQYAEHRHPRLKGPDSADGCIWHEYTDPTGRPVAWKVRVPCTRTECGGRKFVWRYLDTDGQITHDRSARPAQMPLYRQAEALAAGQAGRPVYVTEGESDADAVAATGQAATTHGNADTGKGGSWKPHHTAALLSAGVREVFVCADRDTSGLGHRSARFIAAELTTAGIPQVHVVEAAAGKDVRDHLTAGHTLAELVPVGTEPPATEATEGGDATEATPKTTRKRRFEVVDGEGLGDDAPWSPPAWQTIHMSTRDRWRWHLGDIDHPRGIYRQPNGSGHWDEHPVAPLPYVIGRAVGHAGARASNARYVLSMSADGADPQVVNHLMLATGKWATTMGLRLSLDSKIRDAVGTAIIYMAAEAPELPTAARIDETGRRRPGIDPGRGFGELADTTRAEAMAATAELLAEAAKTQSLTLTIAAAAFGPFTAFLDREGHIHHLVAEGTGNGKTTALRAAMAINGRPGTKDQPGSVHPWKSTKAGIFKLAGKAHSEVLGFDESGVRNIVKPLEFASMLIQLINGEGELLGDGDDDDPRARAPWNGIILSTGNEGILKFAELGDAVAGLRRRAIEFDPPFTVDVDQADRITGRNGAGGIISRMYGHPAAAIRETYSLPEVRTLIEWAEDQIGIPTTTGPLMAAHRFMAEALAGAAMLDTVTTTATGSSPAFTATTLDAARTWLADYRPPLEASDLFREWLEASLAGERGHWPTIDAYIDADRPRPGMDATGSFPTVALPMAGLDRTTYGIRSDDDEHTVYVLKMGMTTAVEQLDLDKSALCRQLHRLGILDIPPARARAKEWTSAHWLRRTGDSPLRRTSYKITLPKNTDESDGGTGGTGSGTGSGTGLARVPKEALTSGGTGGTGLEQSFSRVYAREGAENAAVPLPGTARVDPADPSTWAECWHCQAPLDPQGDTGEGLHPMCSFEVEAAAGAALGQQPPTLGDQGATEPPAGASAGQPSQENRAGRQKGAQGAAGSAGALVDLTQQVADIRRALKRIGRDVTEDVARATLTEWHTATGGMRFVGWAGDTGLSIYSAVTARDGLQARGVATIDPTPSEAVAEASENLALHLDWIAPGITLDRQHLVSEFDVNGQFLASADVGLGHGEPDVLDRAPRDGLRAFKGRPGYVRLASDLRVPADARITHTRAAWDGIPAGRYLAMTSAQHLAKNGVPLDIDRVMWWPVDHSRNHLSAWKTVLRGAREQLMHALGDRPDPAAPAAHALALVKSVASVTLGGMLRSERSTTRYFSVHWSDMIITESWVRALIAVERAGQQGATVLGMRRDSVWLRTDIPAAPSTLAPIAPAGLTISDQLGKWKHSRWAIATDDMITRHSAATPETFNHALKAAHETREGSDQR